MMAKLRGRAAATPRFGKALRIRFDPPAGPHGTALFHAEEDAPKAEVSARAGGGDERCARQCATREIQ